jgi:hypothetical protein
VPRKTGSETEVLVMGDDFVTKADDIVIGCRAKSHRFNKIDFSRLRDGKQTRGVRIEAVVSDSRERQGAYQLIETCLDCGAERTETTLAGGYLADSTRYDYNYSRAAGGNYLAPKGSRIPRRDYRQEYIRRAVEALTYA